MSAHATHDSAAGHDHGHGGTGKYWLVFVALCLLTGMSFFTYSDYWPFHDTPAVGWVFMMAVSCTKAMLVISFFMHLIWEANWKYVLTVPASIMSVFLCIALVGDIGRRTHFYAEERWLHSAEPAPPRHHVSPAQHGDAHEPEGEHSDAKDGAH